MFFILLRMITYLRLFTFIPFYISSHSFFLVLSYVCNVYVILFVFDTISSYKCLHERKKERKNKQTNKSIEKNYHRQFIISLCFMTIELVKGECLWRKLLVLEAISMVINFNGKKNSKIFSINKKIIHGTY